MKRRLYLLQFITLPASDCDIRIVDTIIPALRYEIKNSIPLFSNGRI